tara:strand:- start:8132 stop:9499 length:1368 start_codon:yes stop_codon:yes gene_type:complete
MSLDSLEELVSFCKRRGFVYQSASIYGGLQGVYDFGPLGVELKKNIKDAWWKSMVYMRDDIEGVDAALLTQKHVLKNSGHEDTFSDPMTDCKVCKKRFRTDHLESDKCPSCGATELTESREFNLMLKTNVGPVVDEDAFAYLRPETAQGIFTNFKNVLDSASPKIPFGIAQIGKAFRNEITPKNFIFRVREFEQMELEFFVEPGTDDTWHEYWVENRLKWWEDQGVPRSSLVLEHQTADDLAHYSKATVDILYHFPHGLEELEGVANRTDYDLGSHSKEQQDLHLSATVKTNEESCAKLIVQPQNNDPKKYVPFVIEPSAGVERAFLAILSEAYTKENLADGKSRVVLKLKPHLAPIKVAVTPLAKNKPELVNLAKEVVQKLRQSISGRVALEAGGNIGKMYRKNDEIGTPVCITIDFESIESDVQTVTLRDRDTMEQTRIPVSELPQTIAKMLS